MGWESSVVLWFDLGSLLQGPMRVAKLKSAYNPPIIGPSVLGCETDLKEIMGWKSSDVCRSNHGPLFQGQTRIVKLKSAYNSLIIGSRGLGYQTNL